ncbi:SDR family NAD(P)-dependent oxidoreductase [Kordiimonas sp.]|uniref:SDR family NAD(P)-dependent oxidoreductase n=1 Tax=Kordiimonas sp. TaxID=1970157 RepID=UPI003A95258C
MDLGLKGKRVLVTGGSRGIGAAIVRRFVAEGASVAFCARNPNEVSEVSNTLQAEGHSVVGAACDVSDSNALTRWIQTSAEALGGIDIFIPNVSGGAQAGEEGWQAAFDVDLMATVRGCDLALPYLATSGSGAIVVIASIAGLEAFGGPSAYNTVKAGLISYASQLGAAAAPHGVRVNTVSPGPIHVDDGFWGTVQHTNQEAYDATVSKHPMGRLGSVDEVANCVAFLASPAASWVTRANLVVDGGFLARVQF